MKKKLKHHGTMMNKNISVSKLPHSTIYLYINMFIIQYYNYIRFIKYFVYTTKMLSWEYDVNWNKITF